MTAPGLLVPGQAGGDLGGGAIKTPRRDTDPNPAPPARMRAHQSRRKAPLPAGAGVSPVMPKGGPGCGRTPGEDEKNKTVLDESSEAGMSVAVGMSPVMAGTVEGGAGMPPCGAPGVAPTGGPSSNTPPQTSKSGNTTGGEDWLEWSACVDWGDNWLDLRERLNRAKEAAQDPKFAKETGWDILTFVDWQLFAEPEGARNGLYFAFRLNGPGVTVLIQDRQRPKKNVPNVILRSNGASCLQWGGSGCLDRGRSVLRAMGGTINAEHLTRVDMALDMPGVGMGVFHGAFLEKRYITRAKGRGFHESSGVCVYLGKSPLMLRIYDKVAEVQIHRDPVKEYNMVVHRWHETMPEEAIRVEFELRRESLKEHGIDTPDDYFRKRADLAAYLGGEWVRFTSETVNRTNTSRMAVLPLWQTVADGFKGWTGEPAGFPLTPLERGKVDVRQLEKQGMGTLLTAAVLSGKAETPEDFTVFCRRVLTQYLARVNWQREVAVRKVYA